LRMLGKIAATSSVTAEIAAQDFEQQRAALIQKYHNKSRVRAYFQISATPLLTINGEHIISDVLQLCGGRNVFADTPMLVTTISDEALVQAQPEIMLGLATTKNQAVEAIDAWRKLPVRVARLGKTGFVHPDIISRSTPRILLGASQICTYIDSARH